MTLPSAFSSGPVQLHWESALGLGSATWWQIDAGNAIYRIINEPRDQNIKFHQIELTKMMNSIANELKLLNLIKKRNKRNYIDYNYLNKNIKIHRIKSI